MAEARAEPAVVVALSLTEAVPLKAQQLSLLRFLLQGLPHPLQLLERTP